MAPAAGRRARGALAKTARREAILDGLEELFGHTPYERITVAGVARHAGLAKGTVYLYFPTREAMFLALHLRHATAFAGELVAMAEGTLAPAALARKIARRLAGVPMVLRLMALAPTVLERNVDTVTVAAFKHDLLETLVPVAAALERSVAGFAAGDGFRFLIRLNALAVGFSEMANPGPAVASALAAHPELRPLRIDFAGELAAALAVLLGAGTAVHGRPSRS